ncbi:hypothetical protein B0H17DRAFT_1138295 [Mycena rosella]|uniref:Uncharacterized protein n=1 Tax=Mycena rosella TaxID=1033263 RepID=A0AAD7D6Q5_MYCRO|nr:hypothetical protein B0H17DRAFT_1138295 [Mycena rosella]
MLQTMLERFFPVTPAPRRHPRGGVFVPSHLNSLAPAPALKLSSPNSSPTRHVPRQLACDIAPPAPAPQSLDGHPAGAAILNQDHAAHVRMNELLWTVATCAASLSPAGPPEASFALRLPHDVPSTPRNTKTTLAWSCVKPPGLRDVPGLLAGRQPGTEIHDMADTDSRGYSYEMEQRIEFKARLGPAIHFYLGTHPVIYQINIAGGSIRVLSPHYDNYMAQSLKTRPPTSSVKLQGPRSLHSRAPSTRRRVGPHHCRRRPLRRAAWLKLDPHQRPQPRSTPSSLPNLMDPLVPVSEAHENFWQSAGGDEGEGHDNGWLTDLIEEADAEGL